MKKWTMFLVSLGVAGCMMLGAHATNDQDNEVKVINKTPCNNMSISVDYQIGSRSVTESPSGLIEVTRNKKVSEELKGLQSTKEAVFSFPQEVGSVRIRVTGCEKSMMNLGYMQLKKCMSQNIQFNPTKQKSLVITNDGDQLSIN